MWRDELERRATAYLSALIARGNDIDLRAALQDELDNFDLWLASDPAQCPPLSVADIEQLELRRALGVA